MKPRGRPCSPASRRSPSSQAVSGQSMPRDAERRPADGGDVRDEHPPVPPRQEAAEREEHEEAEVGQHHRVGEEAVEHVPRMARGGPVVIP